MTNKVRCSNCRKLKSNKEYYKRVPPNQGYDKTCKTCKSEYNKKRYINIKESLTDEEKKQILKIGSIKRNERYKNDETFRLKHQKRALVYYYKKKMRER